MENFLKNLRSALATTFRTLGKLISHLFDAFCAHLDERAEQDKLSKQQYAVQQRQTYKAILYDRFKVDYDTFASDFCACLNNNYAYYGLSSVNQATAIYCANMADRIDESFSVNGYCHIIFRYEVRRAAATDKRPLTAKEIQQHLQRDLPKYVENSGYFFSSLTVSDIGAKSVRIEVRGVDRC